MNLQLFAFHHLNLAYSAISEEDRPKVIERCYWPLLRLARKLNLPFGIELSGYTLETIAEIDPAWVAEFRSLITDGLCELIGSGYAQIIGPLVPPEVNEANLRLGHQTYEKLLGVRPKIALLNEQAYSAGLVPIYKSAGYEAIIMEWNNPYRGHPEWDPEWRYLPQFALGTAAVELPLIWNKSITFQKFQRYAHGELELDEFMNYLRGHLSGKTRALSLYGNDVEIFDFRPGRYMTEAPISSAGEWVRIEQLYTAIREDERFLLIAPSQVLQLMGIGGAGNVLQLESAAQPVPVKKQDKYNITRWAVTGRGDLEINTRCWRIFECLKASDTATEQDWQELCYLWSSDFRTHITEARWKGYLVRLSTFEKKWKFQQRAIPKVNGRLTHNASILKTTQSGRFIDIEGSRLKVRLNNLRGLALDSFTDFSVSEKPLFGTLHHGYYDDIKWSADYYTGHLVFESPGRPKITDLTAVEPVITETAEGAVIAADIATQIGLIKKQWRIKDASGEVVLSYFIDWPEPVFGSLRLGHLTLFPDSFDAGSLGYATHNGGKEKELFSLAGCEVNHGHFVSLLVSTSHAIGATKGMTEICDKNIAVVIEIDKTKAAGVSLIQHCEVSNSFFARATVSLAEIDDTSTMIVPFRLNTSISLSARKVAFADFSQPKVLSETG